MKVSYILSKDDFLEHQLYNSSQSELHKKSRIRSRIIVPILYLLLAIYLMVVPKAITASILCVGIAVLWFLFHSIYSKWKYKRHFLKHIKANYTERIGKKIEIEFGINSMKMKDAASESKIPLSELKKIIEAPNHFFIELSSGLTVIIPKKEVENQAEFKSKMEILNVTYLDESDWKWE